MAAWRSIILSLGALLVLAVMVPAVAAAGGHASGEPGAGGLSAGTSHADTGGIGTGARAAGDGGPSTVSRGGVDGSVGQTDARATDRLRGVSASHQTRALSAVVDRSAFAGGLAYRGGTGLRDSGLESGASAGGPRPEVTHPVNREYVPRSGTVVPRTVRGSAGDGGTGRDGGTEGPAPRDCGGHGPPGTANPVPYAAPTRPADEPKGPAPGTKEPANGRNRKDGTHPTAVTGDGTETPDPRLLLQFLLVLGFRRVRPVNVLEHPLRRALHIAIGADPGLNLAGCAAATGANRETLRYHLALLVCCGKVTEETRSGSVRYFPHDPVMTPVRRALVHALRNESRASTLSVIREVPGISRHELADRLGLAGPSVTRQVQRLIEDGLVERERCGRSTCYRLTPDCAAAFGLSLATGIESVPAPDRAAA